MTTTFFTNKAKLEEYVNSLLNKNRSVGIYRCSGGWSVSTKGGWLYRRA